MNSISLIFDTLDPNQQKAVTNLTNTVVAAGAGSGKTRVLSARFLYLLIEKKIPLDEIYALTFTQKAATEMYDRIYKNLIEIANSSLSSQTQTLARDALASFEQANISTLDSLCNSIARQTCSRYGIAPDFSIDQDQVQKIAEDLALPFFIEHRNTACIKQLLKKYSLKDLPQKLFASTIVKYSTISSPIDFDACYQKQKSEIALQFPKEANDIYSLVNRLSEIVSDQKLNNATCDSIRNALLNGFELPSITNFDEIQQFNEILFKINSIKMPGNVAKSELVEIKELLNKLRYRHSVSFFSLTNWIFNEAFLHETMKLLADFQNLFLIQKRALGVLSFSDVSRIALDALIADPSLRYTYKSRISAIMIDEFQDNNQLQRDLLFSLAEKKERTECSIPKPEELCPDKLFFVGDEKQSIYRFRGADVSVFRQLAQDISSSQASLELGINYRSESALLETFNAIFPIVFKKETEFQLFDARFNAIGTHKRTKEIEPSLELFIINEVNFDTSVQYQVSAKETEAAFIAEHMQKIKESGYLISDKKSTRPCTWDDFAILFRSTTQQHLYEKYLQEANIPYQTESLRGLFHDAPINDLYALLRLAVYPEDINAYAIVLRSPFVRLSAEGFTSTLLARTGGSSEASIPQKIFSEEVEQFLSEQDLKQFRQARDLYVRIQKMADHVTHAELITHLWYTEGYRFNVITKPDLYSYVELYDYFFELARQADDQGLNLSEFLDKLAKLMETGEKIEGLNIPVERSGGVKLMTIHKSKGLEFPIVFVVDSGNEGRSITNTEPTYFSEETGVSINTGEAEESEQANTNWFYIKDRDDDIEKTEAELRRLLYVAMTRAETRVIITGCLNTPNAAPTVAREGKDLTEELNQWLEKKQNSNDEKTKKGKIVVKKSFFDLLIPAFCAKTIDTIFLKEVLPYTINHRYKNENLLQKQIPFEIAQKDTLYKNALCTEIQSPFKNKISATGLKEVIVHKIIHSDPIASKTFIAEQTDKTKIDLLLKKLDLDASSFGTIVHKHIESRLTNNKFKIQNELLEIVHSMGNAFFDSPLGKLVVKSDWYKSEFSFITKYKVQDRELLVTGQMDLLFEHANTIYIVDYKTDKIEDPLIHKDQLSVYQKAASDLYPTKKIEAWIFYPLSGNSFMLNSSLRL